MPRTAVVIVHGMGEQLPLETLNRFVRTALEPTGGVRRYFSRPARVTNSYEARRHLAFRQTEGDAVVHGQTEFFEYHWSYLMAGNRLPDLLPTLRRMLLRTPATVPSGLRVVWWFTWALIFVLLTAVVGLLVRGTLTNISSLGVVAAVAGPGIVGAAVVALAKWLGGTVTDSFVDVVRYLDRSPRSYEVRRAIRAGMVDLLRGLHDDPRYSRIVVVAHSLGGYIAYDGITALWPELARLHAGPLDGDAAPLPGLAEIELAADRVRTHPDGPLNDVEQAELDEFRSLQDDLWVELRRQGNPWLVTDLVTVGTPMYFADLLYTRNRREFAQQVKNGEVPQCPPRHRAQTVEGPDLPKVRYGRPNHGRTVLTDDEPFAVVRWGNLWSLPSEASSAIGSVGPCAPCSATVSSTGR